MSKWRKLFLIGCSNTILSSIANRFTSLTSKSGGQYDGALLAVEKTYRLQIKMIFLEANQFQKCKDQTLATTIVILYIRMCSEYLARPKHH